MTEPTEAQIKEACEKANALIRTIVPPNVLTKISVDPKTSYIDDAFVRLVMEHEAFRQRVSEFAKRVYGLGVWINEDLRDVAETFIQPDPTPTPEQVLAEALRTRLGLDGEDYVQELIEALAKRGHHVAPIKDTRHD